METQKKLITSDEFDIIQLAIGVYNSKIMTIGLWAGSIGLVSLILITILSRVIDANLLFETNPWIIYLITILACLDFIVIFYSLYKANKNHKKHEQAKQLYKERETHSDAPLSKKDIMIKIGLGLRGDIRIHFQRK